MDTNTCMDSSRSDAMFHRVVFAHRAMMTIMIIWSLFSL